MPLTILHAAAGAAAGAAFYAADSALADAPIDPADLSHAAIIGGIAGALPDILEPPLNRYHRSFFHSFSTLASVPLLYNSIHSDDSIDRRTKSLAKSALAAYTSHLLLDARTPAGLPLVFDFRWIGRRLFT